MKDFTTFFVGLLVGTALLSAATGRGWLPQTWKHVDADRSVAFNIPVNAKGPFYVLREEARQASQQAAWLGTQARKKMAHLVN